MLEEKISGKLSTGDRRRDIVRKTEEEIRHKVSGFGASMASSVGVDG
ncbi:hypothetical protein [Nonomuraea sp. B19D2]